jgi:hypothetical protein
MRRIGSRRQDRTESGEREERDHDPRPSPAERLQALQRSAGNQAVARWVAGGRRLDRVSAAEVQKECTIDPDFARHYPRWLETKVKAAGIDEEKLLAPFTLEKLKAAVSQSAVHARNFHIVDEAVQKEHPWTPRALVNPGEQVRLALEDQLGLMAKSPTLQAAGAPLGSLGGIIKNIELLKPPDFEQRFFATASDRGLNLAESVATIDYALGFAVRGAVCLRLGSGGNLVSIHPAVHEAIHALAERGAVTGFGPVLNEGVTELLAQKVIEEVGPSSDQSKFWQLSGNPYATQRDRVAQLVATKGVSLEQLFRLNFNYLMGDSKVGNAVDTFRAETKI